VSAIPEWLLALAWASLALCSFCALWIAADEFRHPQKMWIMNLVWPLTALYAGPLAVWTYRRTLPQMRKVGPGRPQPHSRPGKSSDLNEPDRIQVLLASFHCGAGCTLGDIVGETLVPLIGFVFAGKFGSKLIGDFAFAYLLGIAFQYFTIAPMRGLSLPDGIKAALRADTISILLFEIGMFGWMALTYFVFFPSPHLAPSEATFWFMMQIAMILGLVTSFPANAWLIGKGWKEKMPPDEAGDHLHRDLRAA
jgi:Domain of unknown function (DUF4396)